MFGGCPDLLPLLTRTNILRPVVVVKGKLGSKVPMPDEQRGAAPAYAGAAPGQRLHCRVRHGRVDWSPLPLRGPPVWPSTYARQSPKRQEGLSRRRTEQP